MKLTTLLIFLAIFQCNASSLVPQIGFRKNSSNCMKVMRLISNRTVYLFKSNSTDSPYKSVSIDMQLALNQEEVNIFSQVSHDITKATIISNESDLRNMPNLAKQSANLIIDGIVTDEKNIPLPGATVKIKGSITATVTDIKGQFKITVPNNSAILVFSYVGMINSEIQVTAGKSMQIQLNQDQSRMKEIVIVGYGSVKRSDLTGSVSSVTAEQITQVKAVSNISQVLQGTAAGVQVNQASGQPGEAIIIKIRGTNSINGGNDPLYVVDSLPTDGITAQLNPDDIERIEVLKDASSTAIYGSKGANGVIMITTKRGKYGKTAINYNGYYGTQRLRKKLKIVNAHDFALLQNEVTANDNSSGFNDPAKPLPWTGSQLDSLSRQGTDWQDLVYHNASVQDHTLSISGGSDLTNYYTSFGYYDQNGIIANSGFRRFSFRVNLDHKINKKLSVNSNISIQNTIYRQAVYSNADGGGGIPFTTLVMPPTQGVYDASGNYSKFTGVSYGESNPVAIAKELYDPVTNLRFLGRTNVIYEFVAGLKLNASAGIDAAYDKSDYYAPSNISIGQPGGRAAKNYGNNGTFTTEDYLNYTKSFGRHIINATAGVSFQTSNAQNLSSGTAVGFISDVFQDNNIGAATTPAKPESGYTDSRLLSYLGRANYNYAGKYYVTLTGRYDGSSKFSADSKYAFFPSAAIAWRVSEEDFLKQAAIISNLKVKATYGLSGNQAIGNYQTLARLSNANVVFDNQDNVAYIQSALAYHNLKWETTKQLDLGLELGLFKERLSLTIDYYDKRTVDLLLSVDLPTSTGFSSVLQNIGAVRNRGFELQFSTINTIGKLKWTSSITIQRNTNKVLDLGKNPQGVPVTYKEIGIGGNWFPTILGNPTGQLYGYKVLGIYQSDAEAVENGEPTKRAGDYKFWDKDGNKVIDGNDRSILTHLQPDFTYGFNNNFSYRSLTISLLFIGSYGNQIVNEFSKYQNTLNGLWAPSQAAFDNRWTAATQGNAVDRPSVNSGSSIRDYANSTWVSPGSYLKLRDITLTYNLPRKFIDRLGFASLNFFISAQNYITITKYDGYDPEVSWSNSNVNGWDRGNYPSMKSITAGIKAGF